MGQAGIPTGPFPGHLGHARDSAGTPQRRKPMPQRATAGTPGPWLGHRATNGTPPGHRTRTQFRTRASRTTRPRNMSSRLGGFAQDSLPPTSDCTARHKRRRRQRSSTPAGPSRRRRVSLRPYISGRGPIRALAADARPQGSPPRSSDHERRVGGARNRRRVVTQVRCYARYPLACANEPRPERCRKALSKASGVQANTGDTFEAKMGERPRKRDALVARLNQHARMHTRTSTQEGIISRQIAQCARHIPRCPPRPTANRVLTAESLRMVLRFGPPLAAFDSLGADFA